MIDFESPMVFLLLLLIPLLFLLRKFKIFKRVSFPVVLSDWNGKSFVWKDKTLRLLSFFAKFLIIVAVTLVVIALANPYKSIQEKQYTSLGTDVIFVIDTSPSMAVKDIDGNTRLSVALDTIGKIAGENSGSRFGAVSLGSEAALIVPPTPDFSVFQNRLSQINIGEMGNGSAIGVGLSTAVYHLSKSSAPKKCIILLTDGENNAGDIHPETAAKLAGENQISLYVVGIGTKGTVPIEYVDPKTQKLYTGYLDSSFDAASLKKLANIGNGNYFETSSVEGLLSILKAVSKEESVIQNYSYKITTIYLYRQFLIGAIVLFAVAFLLRRICGD